jgi:uncharacterized protein (TIGR00369 family)
VRDLPSDVTDTEHYRKLERMYAAAPISRLYGATIAIAENQAEVRFTIRPEFYHAAHAVHGSVYFRALDDAAFFAVNSRVREVLVLTVSFTVHFARPVTTGELRAIGRVLHGSGRLFLGEAELLDGEGQLLGRGSGVFTRSAIALEPGIGYA